MDDFSTISISNTISKDSVDEEMSLIRATMEDAENRLTEEIRQESISNDVLNDSKVTAANLPKKNGLGQKLAQLCGGHAFVSE